ncbi:CaiB/BaiF CoA transferase family protein [Salibacterium aidingense]|uniref:CaiB/BaiF CoA transferase family protein n=1 Tax=Salibacterium aidingense TaxID=384933 RepID=UPI003BC10857
MLVLDFSQFLSGPSASLRLADLGARVIKIERENTGDPCRRLTLKNININDDSLLFHTINRNKESYTADLKKNNDLLKIKELISYADVVIENFRPGTMEKFELDYKSLAKINPGLIYGSISGYGKEGPWRDKPGQDLLAQALSGLTWLNGNKDQPPTPFGLSVADLLAGAHLAQGILTCLIKKGASGKGDLVEVSLLESLLQFQFEVFTTHLNDGEKEPIRSKANNAHAYLAAPYGIYETKDGYIALAMGSVVTLGKLLASPELRKYEDPDTWFTKRDEIKEIIANKLKEQPTDEWINILESGEYWCSDVFNWEQLIKHEGFHALDMIQDIVIAEDTSVKTTRSPIRIDGEIIKSSKKAPLLGEDNQKIDDEFHLTGGAL